MQRTGWHVREYFANRMDDRNFLPIKRMNASLNCVWFSCDSNSATTESRMKKSINADLSFGTAISSKLAKEQSWLNYYYKNQSLCNLAGKPIHDSHSVAGRYSYPHAQIRSPYMTYLIQQY